jgi:hypothetical protein
LAPSPGRSDRRIGSGACRALAFAIACSLGCYAREALAMICSDGSRFYPYSGAVVGTDAQIWWTAPIGSGLPHLERAAGGEVKLVRVELREINHQWWGHRPLQRYSPVMPLEPGEYWLSFQPQASASGRVAERMLADRGTPFRVVSGSEEERVPLPEQRGLRFFTGRADSGDPGSATQIATFELSLALGVLVADFGDADDDPLESLYFERRRNGTQLEFLLGSGFCDSNLLTAPCMHTRVRFGALSASGRFSGWTPWSELDFPGEHCPSPAIPGVAPPRGRSLVLWGALSAAAALVAGWFVRRRAP